MCMLPLNAEVVHMYTMAFCTTSDPVESFSGSQLNTVSASKQIINDDESKEDAVSSSNVIPYSERKLSQVTIKQILAAIKDRKEQKSSDGPLIVDGVEVTQVHLVVRLLSKNVTNVNVEYRINDLTGSLMAQEWISDVHPSNKTLPMYVYSMQHSQLYVFLFQYCV